jgi:hypothetical protein
MAILSRVKVMAALAELTILILPPGLLVVPNASAHAASGIQCRHTFIPSPNVGSGDNALDGVATIPSTDMWAVGGFGPAGAGASQTLVERWNGASWSLVPNPAANVPGFGGNLHGIAATNPLRVWTVGEEFNNSTIDQTLTEHWTLSGWQVLTNPPIGTNFSFLRAVSSPKKQTPLAFAWAVGAFLNNGASSQTLTELIACTGGR